MVEDRPGIRRKPRKKWKRMSQMEKRKEIPVGRVNEEEARPVGKEGEQENRMDIDTHLPRY